VDTRVESLEFLPVELSKTYALTGWAKSGDELGQRFVGDNQQSFGFESYDADHLLIGAEHVLRHLGSADSRLAAPLNPGDTVIRLQSASGWSNASAMEATRGIAWYGYQDSHGTTYADYTYTRNGAKSSVQRGDEVDGAASRLAAPATSWMASLQSCEWRCTRRAPRTRIVPSDFPCVATDRHNATGRRRLAGGG
jgi:hypothetical protein